MKLPFYLRTGAAPDAYRELVGKDTLVRTRSIFVNPSCRYLPTTTRALCRTLRAGLG